MTASASTIAAPLPAYLSLLALALPGVYLTGLAAARRVSEGALSHALAPALGLASWLLTVHAASLLTQSFAAGLSLGTLITGAAAPFIRRTNSADGCSTRSLSWIRIVLVCAVTRPRRRTGDRVPAWQSQASRIGLPTPCQVLSICSIGRAANCLDRLGCQRLRFSGAMDPEARTLAASPTGKLKRMDRPRRRVVRYRGAGRSALIAGDHVDRHRCRGPGGAVRIAPDRRIARPLSPGAARM